MTQVRKWSSEASAAAAEAGQVRKYIRRAGGKWKVYSEAGDVLGTHDSKAEAMDQLAAVETSKSEDSGGEPATPAQEGGPATPDPVEKSWGDLTGDDEAALQYAFAAYVDLNGVVLKSEELGGVEVEPVEKARDLAATIYKVSYAAGHAYFAVGEGAAVHLPGYVTLGKSNLVPIAKAEEQRYTLGVVYPHGEVDFHKDTMTVEELEKAAWSFMQRDGVAGRVGLMHEPGTDGAGQVVESYIYRGPEWKTKAAMDPSQDQTIKPGDWLMGVVWNDVAWKMVKSGRVTGYSLQGVAAKVAFEGYEEKGEQARDGDGRFAPGSGGGVKRPMEIQPKKPDDKKPDRELPLGAL